MTKILITGGTGFIGKHVVRSLIQEGHQVTIVSRKDKKFDNISGHKIWILAAGLMGSTSLQENLKGNFFSTIKFVTSIQDVPEKIIYISSVDVYGHGKKTPYTEEDVCLPDTYYGAAKLATECFLSVFCEERKIKLIIFRLSQVYGPGDMSGKVIPTFMDKISNGETLQLVNGGIARRQYIYVTDLVGTITLVVGKKIAGIFNVAGGEVIKIKDVISALEEAIGKKAKISKVRVGEIKECLVNSNKVSRNLTFRPQVSFSEGIALTLKTNA